MRHKTQAVQGHPGARGWPRGVDGGAWGPQHLSPIPSENDFMPLVSAYRVTLLVLELPPVFIERYVNTIVDKLCRVHRTILGLLYIPICRGGSVGRTVVALSTTRVQQYLYIYIFCIRHPMYCRFSPSPTERRFPWGNDAAASRCGAVVIGRL